MTEKRSLLSPTQFNTLAIVAQEIATMEAEMTKLKNKQSAYFELILDAHGYSTKQPLKILGIDGNTKELVVQLNEPETPAS